MTTSDVNTAISRSLQLCEAAALARRYFAAERRTHSVPPRNHDSSPSAPKLLKGSLSTGAIVAQKTGPSGYENGMAAATNDVGLSRCPTDAVSP
ncbi:Beta-lactamase [Acidisarcina polymorpha]|uniref:Beta-lactamase n=1 Tax=Acidisarcina polymorpha TaxID=2211140 RepID=A0A2Z5GA92_9BACT|nr:hypothetical protein [Acidisarcina polymorpha]AXC15506.1 Beta-lactamase [Acidisarcina polymorpha]